MGSDEFTLLSIFPFDFKVDRGGIQYPTTESKSVSKPNPDEGYIDVRFVFGREIDPDINGVYLWNVERVDYNLPEGTTKADIEYTIHAFWDDPHELVSDISDAFKGVV